MTIYVASGSSAASGTYHGAQAVNYVQFTPNSINLTNGSPIVVGTGTHFLAGVEPGYLLSTSASSTLYTVLSITDDTHLTLTSNVTDATGSYNGTPSFPVPNNAFTRVPLRGQNNWDTDNFHFLDHSALTGTVTKSSSSTTITGSGTSFTTQLSVNQVVDIPGGGGTDTVVVKSITDNTHFVVWINPAFSASGQTATKNPDCIAIPAGITGGALGFFVAYLFHDWASNGTGLREADLCVNLPTGVAVTETNQIQGEFVPAVPVGETAIITPITFQAVDGNFISMHVYQNSGGALGMMSDVPGGGGGYGITLQFLGIAA